MGWDRQAPEVVEAPAPIVLGRWVLVAGAAVLASVLLFLLYTAGHMPVLQAMNIWAFSGLPLLAWALAFSARAYAYGGALSHHQFLQAEAQDAQHAWQDWAHRYLAVQASCVLLPDRVSASVVVQDGINLPPRTGQARRVTELPQQPKRAPAGLLLLLSALEPVVRVLPARQPLRVTLLSDVEPEEYAVLRDTWHQIWATDMGLPPPESVTVSAELSYRWIDETLRTGSTAVELILVLQLQGESAYSDGLAALLLCPDKSALAWELPVIGGLLRPMPLDIKRLPHELPIFLQTQTNARQATGLLADSADWQPLMGQAFAAGGALDASLEVGQQWVQERLCGVTGPFSHWLTAALGVEMSRHQQRPLLLLAEDESGHWISTVTTGEIA
ncbi:MULTISPECIES: hypothetical protein [Pseudomonas]|uniref:hypothetical protein n=1 Tax=Pseudomonas TaxID=286 RepID=UPI001A7E2370|nr:MULTISPECIES: hypothetical protein [Pseudomonas]